MSPNPIAITVTGHAEREFAPNRCTVVLRVYADGATREAAAEPAAAAIATVTEQVIALREQDDSPVKRWTLDEIRHTRHRPYSQSGKPKPWVYQSSASITVTFSDFRGIGAFVERAAESEAVNVEHLRWWVSRKAQARRLAKVRHLAVLDAITKAQGYTESLGFGTFQAVAIADPGMLGVAPPPTARPVGAPMMRAVATRLDAPAGAPELVLEPDRITIVADIEARFEAS
ncbi:SIMPL domain-containing protein [Rhodococcus sp. NPDC003318]|uniref:SIMPL domain-containing protein n=1 Tax=Rhodococcus sp. NPDC003318 TaxID=3364503 RepID=UPI0036AB0337